MSKISPQALVDPKANLADDVEVGPFCLIGPDVTIGAGTRLLSHVVVKGRTTIGQSNVIHSHAVIGGPPQDLKYRGEPTGVEIGNNNVFREAVTVNLGTVYGSKVFGGGVTRIGNDNLLMVNTHVGHDAQIGSGCILANNVMIAGHIVIGNKVNLNGGVGINAWVSIGDFAYIDGYSRVHHDVPPFVKTTDNKVRSLNDIGLRRGGFTDSDIEALEDAARNLFLSKEKKTFAAALREFDTMNGLNPHVKCMIEFLRRRDQGKHGRYLESLRPK
ncbi:MAG TPA: acyl-ACP--UDP-N-acetylglucosamine O-acyltransferase [Tepidisphaeraceae bacterium]|nr:acyl-ACP--UDP-N-acetylglucosamine O-acyltransferase [Tepidisphaeraceae bacterium]